MTSKKHFLLLAMATTACLTATGAPVTPQRAAWAAHSFWQLTLRQDATYLADRSAEWGYGDLYLFASKEGGFVVVSGNDRVQPILGYSPTGHIDPSSLPVQLEEWLESYQRLMAYLNEADNADAGEHPQWRRLEAGSPLPKAVGNAVEPLLTTLWDQYTPYNNLCPDGTVTGCAATAQAQLMKYWNHPAFGNGTHSYVHNTYGLLSADFHHTLYDWDHMPDSATSLSPAREQEAVATLMFHVGVTLDMQYATAQGGGSAAAGLAGMPGYASMDNSLKDYFHYSPSMRVVTKSQGFSDASWSDSLMAELDLHHPILYTGTAPQGGHGFVCDGYDTLGMFHFNFGWSGIGNGWYAIGNITPGIGPNGTLGQYDFSSNNQALLGAVPVYALRLSDTVKAFIREGGADSLLLGLNPTLGDTPWNASVDADWLTLQHGSIADAGWIYISATENTSGAQRVATVTFRQGGETAILRVVQDRYGEEDYCPVTVVMESRRGNGWLGGARLTLESEGGLVYGTAQMAGGAVDSVSIRVSPMPLRAVWHTGGGTDRFVNYTLKDPYGNVLLSVENAFLNDDLHVLTNPCALVGIADGTTGWESNISLFPNPAHDVAIVNVPTGSTIELVDMAGRTVLRSIDGHRLDLRGLTAGIYMVRIVSSGHTALKRIVVR